MKKVRRGVEMLAFTKRFSSKELKGFLRHGLINLHRSVIFPSDETTRGRTGDMLAVPLQIEFTKANV